MPDDGEGRSTSTTPVTDTVVTTQVDGVPHRVLRTEFVEHLEHTGRVMACPRAARNALRVPQADRHVVARPARARAGRCDKRRTSRGARS